MIKRLLILLLLLPLTGVIFAQELKFPTQEFPTPGPLTVYDSLYLVSLPQAHMPEALRGNPLPPVVDNSELPYLRPVFNQEGPSCGQACLVGYNFTYELDRNRGVSANLPENQYATHFTYNFMNGGSGWYGVSYFHSMEVLRYCGNMDVIDYGGTFYDDGIRWISGYDVYYRAMFNRISGAYSINTSTEEGIMTLKNWLVNHLEGEETGGVASYYANTPWNARNLNDTTPEGGKYVIVAWSPEPTHAMTIVGYNDSIRWDYNQDGQYTNDIDITGDGIIDPRDWEIGGVKFVNSHGYVNDSGFCYMMYKVLAESKENGGIWNSSVHILDIRENYEPLLTYKISLKHNYREKIRVRAGISCDTLTNIPEHVMDFPIFNYQGGKRYMQGLDTAEYLKTIEFGLDVTPLLSYMENSQKAKFFLLIDEDDPKNEGTGELIAFSIIDYTHGEEEVICKDALKPLVENGLTKASIKHSLDIDKPEVTTSLLPLFSPGEPFSQSLTASGGHGPYTWHAIHASTITTGFQEYFPIEETQLMPDTGNQVILGVPLDFEFPYFGKNYDTVYMNADGYIQFSQDKLPWPYLLDQYILLKRNSIIAPLASNELVIEPDYEDGAWYQGNDTMATFRWKLSWEGDLYSSVYDFSLSIFPSGEILFNYDTVTPGDMHWVSGISNGDMNNFSLSPIESLEAIKKGTSIRFSPAPFPTGMELDLDGTFHGVPVDDAYIYDLNFMVTDNNSISSTKSLKFSTGPVIKYTIIGAGSHSIGYGDTVHVDATLYNFSQESLASGSLLLDLDDPYTTVLKYKANTATVAPGDSLFLPSCFEIALDFNTPDQHPLLFRSALNAGEKTWHCEFEEKVNSPVLNLMEASIVDGNFGILQPGASGTLRISIINEGHSDMSGVTGHLSVLDPILRIEYGELLYFGKLTRGNEATANSFLQAKEDVIEGSVARLILEINSIEGMTRTDTILVQIGRKPALVIDLDPNAHSAPFIFQTLQEIGINTDFRNNVPDNLDSYQSVFLSLGYYNSSHELSYREGALLSAYLNHGGNLYMEGRKTWKEDPWTSVHAKFNIGVTGAPHWQDQIKGIESTFMEGIVMANNAVQPFSMYWLVAEAPALELMQDTLNQNCCAVAYDAGNYRTIGAVFELGTLEDDEYPSTKAEMLLRILNFFGVRYSLTDVYEASAGQGIRLDIYPNPFREMVTFRIKNDKGPQAVNLKIYDLQGRLVRNFGNIPGTGGIHDIQWNGTTDHGSRAARGIYFYRLDTEGCSTSGKIILQ